VSLDLYQASRDVIERALFDGALDIAVILVSNLGARESLQSETLIRSRRRLWLPVEHALMKQDKVQLCDVEEHPYVMLTVDEAGHTASRYWSRTAFKPNVIFRTLSVEAVRSMVAVGMGITVLSDMVYRPWSLEGQRREIWVVEDDVPTMDVGLAGAFRQG
jgi:DNA-binding transcriptional LysR family regulator